jgi:pimeloyl-ACP methyl ester carboxylesterase
MDHMNTVTSRDGTAIAFDRAGKGPPVILVGGALSDRSTARPLSARLASDFTVFAYDRRGRGDSGDTLPYAVEREIEDISALVAKAGGSAFAFGHSSGAVLALEAAARDFGILKLALYEPPFIVDDSRPPLPEDYLAHLAELVMAGRRGDAIEYFLTTAVGVAADAVSRMQRSPTWQAQEKLAHTLAYDAAVMGDTMAGRPLPAGRWSSVGIPTLVLDGADSSRWQGNAARALAEMLPGARHLTLEGQTHAAAPRVLAPVLNEFFAG